MSLKVKQIRVGPTFISSTKDVVAASNCYVHCFHNNNNNTNNNNNNEYLTDPLQMAFHC